MITAADFEAALRRVPGALGRQVASLDALAKGANEALQSAPKSLTIKGAAAFMATMSQESASFRTTEEYSKTGRYKPYIGRTFEQITWQDNYALFGAWCVKKKLLTDSQYFVKNPKALADLKWAWLGGIWYWESKGIWAYADDFLKTQKAVNLGSPTSKYTPVGMTARNQWFNAWLKTGDDLLPDVKPELPSYDISDYTHGPGPGVLSHDVIPNEWPDKAVNPTIGLKESASRLDRELQDQAINLDGILKLLGKD